jgi:uncharacterized membrane protein
MKRGSPCLGDGPARGVSEARYPDETTALQALDEAQNLAADLIIETDVAAAIVRHADGKYQVTTKHGPTAGGDATWGMFWGLLFGLLFFIPVFGMAVGAGLGALFGHLEKSTIDQGVPAAGA